MRAYSGLFGLTSVLFICGEGAGAFLGSSDGPWHGVFLKASEELLPLQSSR